MEQAVRMFAEQGYAQTRLEDVASALGKTKPFIYSYFKNKADILSQASQLGIRAFHAASREALTREGTPTERLDWLIRELTDAVVTYESNISIFFRNELEIDPDTRAQIAQMQREFDKNLMSILEDGVAEGEFDIPNLRATTLAIGGMISWIYTWHRPGSRMKRIDLQQTMSDLVLKLVGNPTR
ncbi:MAG: TetR/AcrR family transcriptional regulator [Pseudooceanicola nanhaiensis]|uniref:TetR/AcrR family transcriptional regulator n=1 Tax=Rhodobacterales TaxID=204455 RepID=UPI004057D5B6